MSDVIITCALTGVLTDPKVHPVPVTAQEMACAAQEAYDAGASIVHVHVRDPRPGMGHLPSWSPDVAAEVVAAIRARAPGLRINFTTGVVGDDVSGPIACLRRVRPEIAACNAGTLNYLKTRADGSWAWPPMVFDNPVSKVARMLEVMREIGARPEMECFDVGIVRSIGLYVDNGILENPFYNFVMGVASGMPADPALLPLLIGYARSGSRWQVTGIGRDEVWALHRRAAELGGDLRTGLEDTFYLPDGKKARSNGELVAALAQIAREAGRRVVQPAA